MSEKISIGKATELNVISKLIDSGLDVYVPTVDRGIDCIIRVDGEHYYDIQIKRSPWNVSVRGAKEIVSYAERKPRNYFLIIEIRKDEEFKYIYLTPEQIVKECAKRFPKGEVDINVTADKRDTLIDSQSLNNLIGKLKA
jgi:hypothetical protein